MPAREWRISESGAYLCHIISSYEETDLEPRHPGSILNNDFSANKQIEKANQRTNV